MKSTIVKTMNLVKNFAVEPPLHKVLFNPFASKKMICALNGIGFNIKSSEILGVVGPNGAGKTTLMRILAGILEADSGYIKLCGQELNGKSYMNANVGYVSNDERSFFWRLTGIQNLQFFARLYGINKIEARKRMTKLLTMFALEKKATQLFRDYSTGTRKKFALARALVHQPMILLLDEVTNSLDFSSAQNVKSLVRRYVSNCQGRCAIWSTHRFEEIGEICDRVLVLNEGSMKYLGSAADLGEKYYLKDRSTTEDSSYCMSNVFK